MNFKFVHVADLHLDSPFVGLRSAPDPVTRALEGASFAAYDRVIATALERQVDFVLIAGDVYDSEDRSLRAQLRFRDGLGRLAQAGIESFVVYGNHDPLDGWSARIEWPQLAHRFGADAVEAVPICRDGLPIAAVYGMSHRHRELRSNLARRFRATGDDAFAIGLLHANVEGIGGHENYAPCCLADLETAGMDYWALGHVHRPTVLRSETPVIVYPGSTQARTRAEQGERCCYVVSIKGGVASLEPVAVDAVRWHSVDIPITGLDSDQALLDRLDDALRELRDDVGDRPAVCSITLSGSGILYHVLSKPRYLEDLLDHLQTDQSGDPFVWVDRVELAATPELDRDERKQAHDFAAELLGIVDEIRASPQRLAELRDELAPLLEQLEKIPRRVAVPFPTDEEQLTDWLERAEAVCLNLLEGGRS